MQQRHHAGPDASPKHPPRRQPETAAAKPHPLVKLQRMIGNATISRLIAQREAPPEEEMLAKHDPDIARSSDGMGGMPEVGMEGGQISDALAGRIQGQRGGGSAMDAGVRSTMETKFGDRFDDVRIHTGGEADSLNRSISAKAFTTGTDIFFSNQASPNDSHLLAHELAHVVQQRGSTSSGGAMTVGPAGDSHEHAADAAASAVSSGGTAVSRCANCDDAQREALPEEEMV